MATIKSSITITGTDAVAAKMAAFIRDTKSSAIPILRSASTILQVAAKARAPVSKSGKKRGKYSHPPGTLRDSIEVGNVFRTRSGISAAVGIKKNQYFTVDDNWWYARWNEFGTTQRIVKNWWGRRGRSHSSGVMPEQPFMRIALRVERPKIQRYVRTRLKEAMFSGGSD